MSELLEKPCEESQEERIMDSKDKKDKKEIEIDNLTDSDIVAFNGKLYRLHRHYTSLYLTDYFIEKTDENKFEYEFDICCRDQRMVGDRSTTREFQRSLYELFKKNTYILPRDTPQEAIYALHTKMLEKRVLDHMLALRSVEAIKAREELYRSNVLQHIQKSLKTISSLLYEEASKGHVAASVSFDISTYTLTKEFIKSTLPDLQIPNSDGKHRNTLCGYVLFLLKDIIEKDSDVEEEFANETLQIWFRQKVQTKFPHLKITIEKPGVVFPTLKFILFESSDSLML